MAKGKVVLGQILKYPKNHLAGTFPAEWDSLKAGGEKEINNKKKKVVREDISTMVKERLT